MEQLTHYTNTFTEKQFPITVVCDEVYLQQNIGSVFRICDAFGVEKIIFSGKNFLFTERKINKTSRSTHKTLSFEIIKEKENLIDFLKKSNAEIIALEITSNSLPISKIKTSKEKPIIIIIGNEINGISEEILKISQQISHITMYGKNSSMNVTQSLAIALFQITENLAI